MSKDTMNQETLMTHCPATGCVKPYPSHARQWRKYNGATAWLFNPWTGRRRNAADVGSDAFGVTLHVDSEPMYAAQNGILSGGSMACNGQQTAHANIGPECAIGGVALGRAMGTDAEVTWTLTSTALAAALAATLAASEAPAKITPLRAAKEWQ